MSRQRLLDSLSARSGLWAAVIIAAGTLLRLWFVGTSQLALVQDEAQYWDWTRHMQLTYYSKGPLIAWIIKTGTVFFGDTEMGVRIGSIFGMAVFPALLWWLLARLWNRRVLAVLAVFLVSVSPLFQALGILMTTDNPFVVCWTLCMIALYAAATPDRNGRDRGLWPYVLLALAFGVGILAKYTMLGLAGLAVVYGLVLRREGLLPARFWTRLFVALGLGMAGGFLPTLIWNMANGFVGYKHVMFLIGVSGDGAKTLFRISRMPEFVGSQFGFLLPWWFALSLTAGWRVGRFLLKRPGATVYSGLSTPQAALLAVFFWPMMLFFFAWSFHTKVLPNWNTVSFVAASILCAAEVERLLAAGVSARGMRWLKAGAWASVGLALFIHLHQLLPIPENLNPAQRLKGWEDLGQHMRDVAQSRFEAPDRVFFMSDVYDLTAELAFYVPGQPRAYCLWWDDRRMNQYDLWGGPDDKLGWDAVLVLRGDAPGVPRIVPEMFDHVEGPYRYTANYRGKPVRQFFYFLCYGYKGPWPNKASGKF